MRKCKNSCFSGKISVTGDSISQGKVYLVGAGPGDAGLITLKGRQLISQADVILHDHLTPSELLWLAGPAAEVISVGKFASRHSMSQPQTNNLLVVKAKNGHSAVQLKGGDPFLCGRGGEEAEACAEAGVKFEVVPGVTGALAVWNYARIPPIHRDYTSNVAIVSGHRKSNKHLEIPKAGIVIFLIGVANIRKIVASLLEAGWPLETKIAAIENGTCYNQRVVTGTLKNFVEIVQATALQTPAVLVVGKVVELYDKLGWFDGKTDDSRYRHTSGKVRASRQHCTSALNRLYRSGGLLRRRFHSGKADGI